MTTLSQPTSKFLTVNGLRLHYLDWGNVSAPPVVCVHGYTSSAQAFNALARQLQDRFHIIAPDVRGHGESAWSPAGEYQFTDQVSDLAEFVDQLGLVRFSLIGTSMGGIIAMAYAGAHSCVGRGREGSSLELNRYLVMVIGTPCHDPCESSSQGRYTT